MSSSTLSPDVSSATATGSSASSASPAVTASGRSTAVPSPLSQPTTPGSPAILPLLPHLATSSTAKPKTPYNIAHRGFRARFPENSIEAFQKALDVGHADALETDVHLTKDKVVVLSHDPTLKRCFGRPENIRDVEWSLIKDLRTTKEPHVPMARLDELLRFLSAPGRESVWVLLDIKRDDDPEELIQRIAETIKQAPGDWAQRIVLGCWQANYVRLCEDLLPGFGISFIGVSVPYANELLRYESVQYYNMLQGVLVGPIGQAFVDKAKKLGRHIIVWTVNAPEWMQWSIEKELDGVITDDPALYADVRKKWEDDTEEPKTTETSPLTKPASARKITATGTSFTGLHIRRWTRLYSWVGFVQTMVLLFTGLARLRWGPSAKRIDAALKR